MSRCAKGVSLTNCCRNKAAVDAPVLLPVHLGLGPSQFAWLFVPTVSGIFLGSLMANRLAGNASQMSALPEFAAQHSILSLARADIPGVAAHMRGKAELFHQQDPVTPRIIRQDGDGIP